MTHWLAAFIALGLLLSSVPASAPRLTAASVAAVGYWVEAVNTHVPGTADASLAEIAAVPLGARVELSVSYPLFIRALLNPRGDENRLELAGRIEALGASTARNPGAATFLRRAATLHFDAVIFARQLSTRSVDRRWSAIADASRAVRAVPESPLLRHETVTLALDGRVVGERAADWNLPFARGLIDDLLQTPAQKTAAREFVSTWYHAVAAYLFANGMTADATSHLRDVARVLPDDARALFDRGTYAETLGLPIYQEVRDDASKVPSVRIPAEAKTNAEAERLYRQTLDNDPTYVEARVRLARLIDLRGAHDEAALEIGKALAARTPGVIGFYADLVAARIAAARGRYDEALRLYRAASTLYVDAQSPRLGASQACWMLGDIPQALTALEHLGRGRGTSSDPWWDYRLGAGRDAKELISALWRNDANGGQ